MQTTTDSGQAPHAIRKVVYWVAAVLVICWIVWLLFFRVQTATLTITVNGKPLADGQLISGDRFIGLDEYGTCTITGFSARSELFVVQSESAESTFTGTIGPDQGVVLDVFKSPVTGNTLFEETVNRKLLGLIPVTDQSRWLNFAQRGSSPAMLTQKLYDDTKAEALAVPIEIPPLEAKN